MSKDSFQEVGIMAVRNHRTPAFGAERGEPPPSARAKKRFYTREEDFLLEYPATAQAAARYLSDQWRLGPPRSDRARKTMWREGLRFECALVDDDDRGFLSVQIYLKSSKRLVVVLVERVENTLVTEKIIDRVR